MTNFGAYERYVGQITAAEFVKPFNGNIEKAVKQLMAEKWWEDEGGPAPEDLAEMITEYVKSELGA